MKKKSLILLIVAFFSFFLMIDKVNAINEGNEIEINVDDNVIYNNSIDGFFEVNEDYDEIRYTISNSSITRTYTTTKTSNYSFTINSLDLDFGNFWINNLVGIKDGNEIEISSINKMITVWDGDMEPPAFNGVFPTNMVYYLDPGSEFGVSFYAEDEKNVIGKVVIEMIDENDNVVTFEKVVNKKTIAPNYIGSTPSWNMDYGLWKVKSIEVCDTSFHENCIKTNVEEDNVEFLLINKKKTYDFNPITTLTLDKRFVLNGENQVLNISFDNDEFTYVYVEFSPFMTDASNHELSVYKMEKNNNNYTLLFTPNGYQYDVYQKWRYPDVLILVDQYGRYQRYNIGYDANNIFRFEDKVSDFIPIVLNASFSKNELYSGPNTETVKFNLDTLEYADNSLKSVIINFYDGTDYYERQYNLAYEGEGKYSCTIELPNQIMGEVSVYSLRLKNKNNYTSYEPYIYYNNLSLNIIERPQFTITFVDDDGITILKEPKNYYYETLSYDIEKPENPVKENTQEYTYSFSGWTPEIADVTEDATYTASYNSTKNKYNVTFVDYDDTVLYETRSYDYGTPVNQIEKPLNPTRESTAQYDYTFSGWSPVVSMVTEDVVYKATYQNSTRSYLVRWRDWDGHYIYSEQYTYGSYPIFKDYGETPHREGTSTTSYIFDGWIPDTHAPIEGDTIFTAKYKSVCKVCGITFVDDDGETILKDRVNYSQGTPASQIVLPPNPTKPSTDQYTYTFAGWSPDIEDVTKNTVYTATYTSEVNKYTVTWKNSDGSTLEIDEDVVYGTMPEYNGDEPSIPNTAAYTYTYTGWDKEIESVTGDVTYTATYSSVKNKYDVTFVDEDGTTILKETTAYDYGTPSSDIIKPSNPTKQNTQEYTYSFSGWTPEITDVIEDITYTATYESIKNKYTVTWKNYDGTTLATDQVEYGVVPTYSGTTPTRPKTQQYTYTFNNWDEEVVAVTGDVTYTAEYNRTVNKYRVKFKSGDTVLIPWTEYDYGTPASQIEVPPTPTKTNTVQYAYAFTGWSPEISDVTEDVVYNATFSQTLRKYPITFMDDDHTTILKETTYYDYHTEVEDIVLPPTPTKPSTQQYSYTFKRWAPQLSFVFREQTYYAEYTATLRSYTIKWKNYDGTTIKSETLTYGTTPTYTGDNPTRDADAQYTYTFAGWDKTISPVTGNETYTATYNTVTNKYNITFVAEDGTTVLKGATSYDYGTTPDQIVQPAAPAKAEYTFAGWTPELSNVTGNTTYVATYVPAVAYLNSNIGSTNENLYGLTENSFALFLIENGVPESVITNTTSFVFNDTDATNNIIDDFDYSYDISRNNDNSVIIGIKDNTAYVQFRGKLHLNPSSRELFLRFGNVTSISGLEYVDTSEVTDMNRMFAEMNSLQTLSLTSFNTSNVTDMSGMFEGCNSLTSINLSTFNTSKVTNMSSMFNQCQSLTDLNLSNFNTINVTNMYEMFWGCSKLNTLNISNFNISNVEEENALSLANCRNLNQIVTPNSLSSGVPLYTTFKTNSEDPTDYTNTLGLPKGSVIRRQYQIYYLDVGNNYNTIYGDRLGELPVAHKNGYTFKNWYTTRLLNTETNEYTYDGLVTEDTILDRNNFNLNENTQVIIYPKYDINKYSVTFVDEDNTVLKAAKEYEYGTNIHEIETPDNPTKEATAEYTYSFNGWTPELAPVTEDVVYKATYRSTKNKYRVTWKNYDETILKAEDVEYGTVPVYDGDTPERIGTNDTLYTFAGWDKEVEAVTGIVEYTAVFNQVARKYTVTFVDEDGVTVLKQATLYPYGTPSSDIVKPDDPTKEATQEATYTFTGWTPEITDVTEDVTYKATYSRSTNKYTVTFVDDDDTILKEATSYDYGTTANDIVKPADPTKTNTAEYTYTFSGWTPAIADVTANVTYKATYNGIKNKYTVIWKDADETTLETDEVEYGSKATYDGDRFNNTYRLIGWYKDKGYTEPYDLNSVVTGELTLYAKTEIKNIAISYTTHVQDVGWQSYVSDGAMAGTSGRSLRLEGIKIKLENNPYSGNIEYRTHIQNIGWESSFKKNDQMSGTSGQSLRLEAIEIKLTGEVAQHYDVYYRVHAQMFGWLGWARNGEQSGTAGYSYRLEGIEIKLVEKGKIFKEYGQNFTFANAQTGTTTPMPDNAKIAYTTHVQDVGWQDYVSDGKMAGTSGRSLRLEGIKIKLVNQQYSGNIEYRTHIQDIGWESSFRKNDQMSGTSGRSLRLEAIEIRLTGEMAQHYDIYYRVHAQMFGWLGWARNGEQSGTAGYAYRLEGIEIKLVEKGTTFSEYGKLYTFVDRVGGYYTPTPTPTVRSVPAPAPVEDVPKIDEPDTTTDPTLETNPEPVVDGEEVVDNNNVPTPQVDETPEIVPTPEEPANNEEPVVGNNEVNNEEQGGEVEEPQVPAPEQQEPPAEPSVPEEPEEPQQNSGE